MSKFTAIVFLLMLTIPVPGQLKNKNGFDPKQSPELQTVLDQAVAAVLQRKSPAAIKPDEIAATVIDLTDPENLRTAAYNGDQRIYPASVVKLFYMVALEQWLADGRAEPTAELERGLRDMIGVSSNDATNYIYDVLTETGNGAELSEKELKKYAHRKNAVNRYFRNLGYLNINVNQKTYCEDIYGRERQFWNEGRERNKLTTDATARLLAEIALGRTVSAERSRKMLNLLKREPFAPTADPEDQAHGFTGIALTDLNLRDVRLFSKAGYTSSARHDAAYLEFPDGKKLVIVIFTVNHAADRSIIPAVAAPVIKYLQPAG